MGKPAPAVKLQDANGKSVALQDFRGKPILLDFWATWCAPCVAAFEPLKKLHEETEQKGLVILSIDEDDDFEAANDFFIKHGVSWPNFRDDGKLWRSLPASSGIPFYVLIDSGGQIVFSQSGPKDSELRAAIAKLGVDLKMSDEKSKQ